MTEKKDEFWEPPSGIIAVPPPKDAPNYNYAEMFKYCDANSMKPKDLSKEERKLFEIPKRKRGQ